MKPTTIEVERTSLQIVFDVAVNSLDFGSGFLDDEEVTALRALAVALEVDPRVATPSGFLCKHYGHSHSEAFPYKCVRCGVER